MNGWFVPKRREGGALGLTALAPMAALALFLMLGLGGCSKKQQQADISGMPESTVSEETVKVPDNDIPVAQPTTEPSDVITGDMGLKPVFFDFDKFDLTAQAREALNNNGRILKEKADAARHHRGPLRRARHRPVQPGPGREARPCGDGLPVQPGHCRRAHGDRLLRQGAPLHDGPRRVVLGPEPPRALRTALGEVRPAARCRAAVRAGASALRAGLLILLLLAPLASGCAYLTSKAELKVNEIAQETRVLRGQQRDLIDEVARIRSLLESEGMVGDEKRAELLVRLDALERAVAQMIARDEEQAAMLQRMSAALDQLTRQAGAPPGAAPGGALPGAAAQPGAAAGAASLPSVAAPEPAPGGTAAPPSAAAADSGVFIPVGEGSTELAIYDAARGDFARGNYALAREGFEELLRRFPDSVLADNGAYWLAESFYAEGQYLQALERYEEILQAYPAGDVLPAALLKTGYCRIELGFTEEAAQAFERVRLLYPESNEAAIAEHKLNGMGAGR